MTTQTKPSRTSNRPIATTRNGFKLYAVRYAVANGRLVRSPIGELWIEAFDRDGDLFAAWSPDEGKSIEECVAYCANG